MAADLGLAGRPPGESMRRGGLLFWLEGRGAEELNDLWQSLRSPGLSGFFPD